MNLMKDFLGNGRKVLLINVCKNELHSFEFAEPVKSIVKELEFDFMEVSYKKLNKNALNWADKIIICGTSLQDNEFLNHAEKFRWIKNCNKPILGICAGMQIIGLAFSGKIKKKTEIGLFYEEFRKEFLGLNGKKEVWHLHNNYMDFFKLNKFEVFSSGKIPQAVKHREREIYGVLFHPEVRNKEVIREFLEKRV